MATLSKVKEDAAEVSGAPPKPPKSTAREYFESICVAVILALFIRTFVVQAFKIPTGSMEQNLLIGDHLLVNKFVYGPRIVVRGLPGGLSYVPQGDVNSPLRRNVYGNRIDNSSVCDSGDIFSGCRVLYCLDD